MFTFFKKTRTLASKDAPSSLPSITETALGETIVDHYKMSLEERKQWRLDMLRISLREVFKSLKFSSGMYRYRLTSLDDRGHHYAVMIETTKLFEQSEYQDLSSIERILQEHTLNNYGITVDAVYWKANSHINMFKRSTDTAPHTPADIQQADTAPSPFESISADEIAAFRAAIASHAVIKVQLNGREYETDLAPLSN